MGMDLYVKFDPPLEIHEAAAMFLISRESLEELLWIDSYTERLEACYEWTGGVHPEWRLALDRMVNDDLCEISMGSSRQWCSPYGWWTGIIPDDFEHESDPAKVRKLLRKMMKVAPEGYRISNGAIRKAVSLYVG